MSDSNAASAIDTTAAHVADFKQLQHDLWVREYLLHLAEWDGATVAPPKGAAARGEAMGALAAEHHELLCGKAARETVAALQEAQAAHPASLDAQTAAELRVLARDQREAMAIPAEEEAAWTRLVCEADAVWHKAKLANDWASFEPFVQRIVDTLKRRAAYIDPARDPYDVLLDQYERGLTRASFDTFCAAVKNAVVPVLHDIVTRGQQPDASFLNAHVPAPVQLELSHDFMKLVGLDMDGMALAQTEHPFSDSAATGDARIATHIYEDDLISNVYSMIHESGHAIYEQNVDPAYAYTCLAGGTSMGIHESQSRFFENTIGRSRAFMGPLLELLRRHVPDVYGSVDEDDLYRAVNIARPSLIRTEADELTYPLHIMVRYEIERMLFAGDATAADIPALWNRFMRDYLGIEVPSDREGCLQDTHWGCGSFGYFPTYALGSAYDAQYVPAMEQDGVDLAAACASGDLTPVSAWLREKIWRWGRAKDAPELIQGACGAPFDVRFYCDYLVDKFTDLYQL